MTADLLLIQHSGAITTLTLNAPATINALSSAMLARLGATLTEIAARPATRVVIMKAEGRNFCAGHDLREIQGLRDAPDLGRAGLTALVTLCASVMQQLARLPQPVIAQVQGVATAAGCQLAASCDMVVASETARFGVNGVNIGLFCHTPLVALSRKVAPAQAFELAATGEFIPAARAHALGLVTRLSPPDTLDETTSALAQTLSGKLPLALAMGKRGAARPLAEAYKVATAIMIDNLMAPETAEGIQAFLEKRPPRWI